jgi:uncharacterized protein (DUF1501 family)
MQRRHFLQLGAGALALLGTSPLLGAAPVKPARLLLLVELAGGNDALNTLAPVHDPQYRKLRPTLGLKADEVLSLSDQEGMNPAMRPLMGAWDKGELAWVRGLGYPSPNRSHFRSIEIWETGSESAEVLEEGWLARLWGQRAPEAAVILGEGDAGPLSGEALRPLVMQDPERFVRQASRLRERHAQATNPALRHILSVQRGVLQGAELLQETLSRAPSPKTAPPGSPLGRQLGLVARLILAGAPVEVFKVTHGGFDTHARQRGQHDRLLGELAEGLAWLRGALTEAGRWSELLLMTYSEFGRRAAENGSGGTDHGTAAAHLLMGGAVKGGLYGEAPSLSALDKGDLRHTVDFRSLYAMVARRWWGLPAGAPGLPPPPPLTGPLA